MARILSVSEAKMKLSQLIESLTALDEEIIITKNGRPAAVLVSPEEFEGWKETLLIRADNDLMTEIKNGLEDLKGGKSRLYTLEELLDRT